MSETEAEDALAESEIVHWSPKRGPLIGSGKASALQPLESQTTPGLAMGALAIGVAALGALAVGAMAIGALVIGRLAVGRARFRNLKIDQLVVDELVVRRRRG